MPPDLFNMTAYDFQGYGQQALHAVLDAIKRGFNADGTLIERQPIPEPAL